MSRLQKKCFLGATSLHFLLLVALVAGPGFFSKEKVEDLAIITFEPGMLTDEKISGGGSPRQGSQTPTQQVQPPPPQPPPPQPVVRNDPKPERVETVEKSEPVKPEPEKIKRNDPDAVTEKQDKPKTREVQISKKVVKIPKSNTQPTTRSTSTSTSESTAKANEAWQKAIAKAGNNISSGIASTAKISMSDGPGGGGVSYANYAQEIQRRYKMAYDRALQAAGDIADGQTSVETSVVILSDGTVVTSSVVKPSGNAALDALTRRVLDSIREVPPFPAGTKDSRRTFNIIFDLKPRNSLG